MIRVGVLTSSRADYGIYYPLLKMMEKDDAIDLKLIVFGTHLSKMHGYTLSQIELDGFRAFRKIESLLLGDSPNAIASAYALTALKFSEFWEEFHKDFDVVFALGDRYEMAAAVVASVPYGVKIAHLHGGETTLGAIDNIYRHSISLASVLHFVSTEAFKNRLIYLLGDANAIIFNVGSLSLENLMNLPLLTMEEFHQQWDIDLNLKTILVTVHPETINPENNLKYSIEIEHALEVLARKYQIVITMPNADTLGIVYRNAFLNLAERNINVVTVENFGTRSYFTCMKYAKLFIGNSSSGIIEAASFGKYVLNLGIRQKGRLANENIINVPFSSQEIIYKAEEFCGRTYHGENLFFRSNSSSKVISLLKEHYESI
jgi:GDP/UDP-N,N'-diacetylbacillosamine 2-epimerase (hydrolysing)